MSPWILVAAGVVVLLLFTFLFARKSTGVTATTAATTTTPTVTCAANQYLLNGACTGCPVGKTSPAGSTSASACV